MWPLKRLTERKGYKTKEYNEWKKKEGVNNYKEK